MQQMRRELAMRCQNGLCIQPVVDRWNPNTLDKINKVRRDCHSHVVPSAAQLTA
jgi:hypothetical protein